jgi:hypothetical protein
MSRISRAMLLGLRVDAPVHQLDQRVGVHVQIDTVRPPEALRPKVVTAVMTISVIGPLGFLAVGQALQYVGMPVVFLAIAVAFTAGALAFAAALRRGEEEGDSVPALDLAAVPAVEGRPDEAAAETADDEGLLRPAVDLRAGDVLGSGREGRLEAREPPAGGGAVRQRAADGIAAQRVRLSAHGVLVRPEGDVERGRRQQDCGENVHLPRIGSRRRIRFRSAGR